MYSIVACRLVGNSWYLLEVPDDLIDPITSGLRVRLEVNSVTSVMGGFWSFVDQDSQTSHCTASNGCGCRCPFRSTMKRLGKCNLTRKGKAHIATSPVPMQARWYMALEALIRDSKS